MTDETIQGWAEDLKEIHGEQECMVVQLLNSDGVDVIRVYGDEGQVIGEHESDDEKLAEQLVDALKDLHIPARMKSTKLVECGICDHFHPQDFTGDCRDDGNRFPTPHDSDDEAECWADGTPGAGEEEEDDSQVDDDGNNRCTSWQEGEEFSHRYSVKLCPKCGNVLTLPEGVVIETSNDENEHKYLGSRLDDDGLLVDVDDVIADGYHSDTLCGQCYERLNEYEVF